MGEQTQIGVLGCTGRMGKMILQAIAADSGVALASAGIRPGSALENRDVNALGLSDAEGLGPVPLSSDLPAVFRAAEAVIDFTLPEPTLCHVEIAAETGTPIIIGTTGLDNSQERRLEELSERVAIVYAPNMSLGVNLLLAVVEQVAAALDPDWDIEIVEMHHNKKVDAPSGTAIGLGRAAAAGRGEVFDQVATLSREGHTGPRERGTIGFATLRGGDVIGEHSVIFAGSGERIELGHRAGGRQIFANGAVKAAKWAAGKNPGLYTMKDVLGL